MPGVAATRVSARRLIRITPAPGRLTAPEATASRPRLPAVTVSLVAATVGTLIAQREIDRLLAQYLDPRGRTASALSGWSPLVPWTGSFDSSWRIWATSVRHAPIKDVLTAEAVTTAALLCLTAVTLTWLTRSLPTLKPHRVRPVLCGAIIALSLVHLGLALSAIHDLAWTPDESVLERYRASAGWASGPLLAVAWVAMAVVAFYLAAILWDPTARAAIRRHLSAAGPALWHQRLTAIVVGLLAVVALIPGPNISDQVPDVLRGWVSGDPAGLRHSLLALAALVVATVVLAVLGRLRTEHDWLKYVAQDDPPWRAPAPVFLAPGAAMLVGIAYLGIRGWTDKIDVVRLLIALLAPAAVWVASHARYRCARAKGAGPVPYRTLLAGRHPVPLRARARTTWLTGDVLAGLLPIVGGLALIRAFTSLAVLPRVHVAGSTAAGQLDTAHGPGWAWLLLGLGFVVIAVWPFGAQWLLAWDGDRSGGGHVGRVLRLPRPPEATHQPAGQRWQGLLALTVAVALLVGMLLRPLGMSGFLGGLALLLLVLAAWVYVVGWFLVTLQRQQPLELFRWAGLRSTPVLSIVALVLLVNTYHGGTPALHATRARGDTPGVVDRPKLDAAFDHWLATSSGCELTVSDDVRVRPMVLVAAAGGGIRAATWTALGMEKLAGAGGGACADAVFLSSGVSGGALGLTVSRAPDSAVATVQHLAQPDGLSAALAGFLVSDLIAGGTGLRIPGDSGSQGQWLDRSGLMETAWLQGPSAPTVDDDLGLEDGLAALAQPWSAEPAAPVGYLILNSAAAGSACRVLVSQIDFGPTSPVKGQTAGTEPVGEPPFCRSFTNLPAASTDLMTFYDSCTPVMDWLTAGMLAARFPLITPGARMPGPPNDEPCDAKADLQLVDGGYAENSGLGTLVDLSPRLMALVRDHNQAVEQALATGSSGSFPSGRPAAFVVPYVVFLDNHFGSDVLGPAPSMAAELAVPLAGWKARGLQTDSGTWLQRITDAIDPACPASTGPCQTAIAQLTEPMTKWNYSGRVVVVAPSTEPSISAPLGWTLSGPSIDRLAEAINVEASVRVIDADKVERSRCPQGAPGGYPCLHVLLDVLDLHGVRG